MRTIAHRGSRLSLGNITGVNGCGVLQWQETAGNVLRENQAATDPAGRLRRVTQKNNLKK